MSNETLEQNDPKPTKVEELQPGDVEVGDESTPVREITQTDHINKAMLQMFKSRIESGDFQFQVHGDDESAMDDEFTDEDDNQQVVEPVADN
ncbi:hypothetical protein RB653_007907 [Dictyostelium firmibasis]|uniref:Uncharacterized protein n=1 Tax=Dictyostelium firmibasis TaxID=79012 RepID=A0AAN7TW86_9MYCE